jgi:hypothetical protein
VRKKNKNLVKKTVDECAFGGAETFSLKFVNKTSFCEREKGFLWIRKDFRVEEAALVVR